MEDISGNLDLSQYGGQIGTGTEHMIVCLVDRIKGLLDRHSDKSSVIASFLDWMSAFDRQDTTIAIEKFIKLGVRASLIPLLISYLSNRKMQVKFNGETSEFLSLIGGGPQGTLLGQLEYLVLSNDNADCVTDEDRYKYIDDLTLLELVCLSGLLTEYNYMEHVPSDIGVGKNYLPAENFQTQDNLNYIAGWSELNKVKLNETKCKYMIFTRSQEDFSTRLRINNHTIDKIQAYKLLGIWITEDLSWEFNTKEMCRKAYSRIAMLTKLKYIGTSTDDLIEIYISFIRSLTEYCAVTFHSSLTGSQTANIERIQKTCLKIILGDNFVSYPAALEMTGLDSLYTRREKRCLNFSLKALKHPVHSRLFPTNRNQNNESTNVRNREKFHVNFARTECYRKSAIPYCQRMLNEHFNK